MKTQKEIEVINDIYQTSDILLSLFEKYKNYDSTFEEHFDPNTLFKKQKRVVSSDKPNVEASLTVDYKQSIWNKILNKIKKFFKK